jgi:hypothetical protein
VWCVRQAAPGQVVLDASTLPQSGSTPARAAATRAAQATANIIALATAAARARNVTVCEFRWRFCDVLVHWPPAVAAKQSRVCYQVAMRKRLLMWWLGRVGIR